MVYDMVFMFTITHNHFKYEKVLVFEPKEKCIFNQMYIKMVKLICTHSIWVGKNWSLWEKVFLHSPRLYLFNENAVDTVILSNIITI